MAFELQTAWDEAESWGAHQVLKELGSKWFANKTSEVLKKLMDMSKVDQEIYQERLRKRQERVQKVQRARRWQSVLSWKLR